jgi:hypothetical protein
LGDTNMNDEVQLELPAAGPGVANDEVAVAAWLEELLLNAGCWMTAKDISLTTGGRVLDRDIRQVASETSNVISGQKGYRHIRCSTAEEINHAANWLESQADKMGKRARAIRRRAHQIFG